MKSDARVDQYISRAPAFAQPILKEVRARVARACPEAVETNKWNVPFFVLGDKLLASMAAFKKHTKIGVWTGMKPNMRDVTVVGELPAARAFEAEVKSAAATIAGGAAKRAPAKKQAAAKKAPAKQAPAKKKAPAKNKAKKG